MLSLIAWHTLVLLASQEAKVGTSWFKASMAKKKKTSISKNKLHMVMHVCNPSCAGGGGK
jgi:hypothetical protein